MRTYDQFAAAVEAAGLTAQQRSRYHWQILGGVKPVNYYPASCRKGPSFYVNGAVTSTRGRAATVSAAIRAAKDGILPQTKSTKRRVLRSLKKRLLAKSPFCMWCKTPVTHETATIEHVIPLSQGGSNRRDNLGLACKPCNKKRGSLAVNPAKPIGSVK